MKKIIFAAIALCALLSCAKEEPVVKDEANAIVFTAEIVSSKTTVSPAGKVDWVLDDEVTISDGTDRGIYTVSDVDAHRFATLTYKSGTQFTSEHSSYTATYGDVNNQWYDATHSGSNCPMKANGVGDGVSAVTFAFHNTCGVVAVKANTGTNKIAQIKIDDKTLNFTTPQALDGTKTYLVAVEAVEEGQYNVSTVAFVKDDGSKSTKTLTTPATVNRNEIRELDTKSYFSTATYDGFEPLVVNGVFSVSDSKKVQFLRGNVYNCGGTVSGNKYQNDGKYAMETEQYNFHTLSPESSNYSYVNGKINNSSFDVNFSGYVKYSNRDAMLASFPNCELLSEGDKGEWAYLLFTRNTTCSGITDANPRYAGCQIKDENDVIIYGTLLFPDNCEWPNGVSEPSYINDQNHNWFNYSTYTIADFQKIQAAGIVFLPNCGNLRDDSGLYYTQMDCINNGSNCYGYYMSSTNNYIYSIEFKSWLKKPAVTSTNGYFNPSVRLVKEL